MTLRALRISLATGSSQLEALPRDVSNNYLGGRGAAAWLLATSLDPDTGPLSPDNLLIFSAGPLAGVSPIASGGFVVTTRSPLTRSIAHSWGLGGWGAALRRAGYDLLAVTGQSPEWCVIQIDGEQVRLLPAQHLLGLDTVATAQAIRGQLGDDFLTVCVGPAGEAGVAYASIVGEGAYPAEPAGTGAVMAAKRIKAIAVRGTASLAPADRTRAEAVAASIRRRIAGSEVAAGVRQAGSLYFLSHADRLGALTSRNGQDSQAPQIQQLARIALAQQGKRAPRGCEGCPLPCHSAFVRKNGEPIAYPELEALAGFGARCGISSPDAVIVANDLCLRLGLDVVETSAALAFMMECQQEGLSTAGTLSWGDSDALVGAIRRLGQRHEKRDVLSLGVGEMQEVFWNSSTFAPQAKGLAMPALDPRALHGVALALATAPIGGDYRYSMFYEELLPEPPAWLSNDPAQPNAVRSRAARLIWHERFAAALDAAGLCRDLALLAFQVSPGDLAELLAAVLGRQMSGVELARLGERIVTLERHLATRFGAAPDGLPQRWSGAPLDELLPDYYRRHGWSETGVPSPARLAELGITGLPD
ncbi:MAG: aldehyde ferredoxin oxidoreductase C-terminal domain-containing protein [Chloroflexota bacterium]